MKENIIIDKSLAFSIKIAGYCKVLYGKKEFIIANPLLRSATSIGSNIFEAQDAESRLDFIHKMRIASKEASETYYWLTLCDKLENFELPPVSFNELKQISALLGRIITTSRKNLD
jgi:four helix bundle protein